MSQPKQPEDNLEAVRLGLWKEWLANPVTKMFFAQLRQDQIDKLLTAANASMQTAIGNAKEHNKLVQAAAIGQIIDKYEHGTKYPFTIKLADASTVGSR